MKNKVVKDSTGENQTRDFSQYAKTEKRAYSDFLSASHVERGNERCREECQGEVNEDVPAAGDIEQVIGYLGVPAVSALNVKNPYRTCRSALREKQYDGQ